MQAPLFADATPIADGAWLLPGLALAAAPALLDAVAGAVWRHYSVPGGGRMSVAMAALGPLGWVADAGGYRYSAVDPLTGQPWPALPPAVQALAQGAAAAAGYVGFAPDACLVNRYAPGARMGLHQDRDERDGRWPIVSVSLGMTATFLWGGPTRRAPVRRLALQHGDVVVWGGPSRYTYHGVAPLAGPPHPLLGAQRLNLTLRRAG